MTRYVLSALVGKTKLSYRSIQQSHSQPQMLTLNPLSFFVSLMSWSSNLEMPFISSPHPSYYNISWCQMALCSWTWETLRLFKCEHKLLQWCFSQFTCHNHKVDLPTKAPYLISSSFISRNCSVSPPTTHSSDIATSRSQVARQSVWLTD